ncbi:MAG: hypothetical protein EPN37_02505 [Chitinophagaceae bacterium]|nr:MAG: hypothetical protein EPN37_02505 [Chitinophagaceae bacterium]
MMDWEYIFQKCLEKIKFTELSIRGNFPHTTRNGIWQTYPSGHWTGGFWVGLLWLKAIYPQKKTDELEKALSQAKRLIDRTKDNKTHDMGFIFGPGCIMGNHIQADSGLRNMAIAGAENLKHLFDKQAGILYAWDEPGYEGVTIVDSIMNIPILIWSANEQHDRELYKMGITLADNIGVNHIRKDYSTYHLIRWDIHTHQVIERSTHQGYSSESCWSRGHAWALYGFANMYRYTKIEKYLRYAINLAEYFWQHLDANLFLPRWDFILKDHADEPLDASAASIAASGMLLLSKMNQETETENPDIWKKRAVQIMESLVKNCLFTDIDRYGLIRNVTVDRPRNSGVNESSIYGDYYFMESVFRLMNYNHDDMTDILY